MPPPGQESDIPTTAQVRELLARNDPEAGKRLCSQLCLREPDNVEARLLLGAIAGQLGDYAQAEECCRAVIARFPEHFSALTNLASALMLSDQTDEAEKFFLAALRIKPDDVTTLNNFGNLRRKQNRLEDARGCYQKALHLAPDYAQAHNNLAATLQELGQFATAIVHYEKAIELQPDSVELRTNLAQCFEKMGDIDTAITKLQELVEIYPTHALIYDYLCYLLELSGRRTEAIEFYQRGAKATDCPILAQRQETGMLGKLFDDYADNFDQHLVGNLQYKTPDLIFELVSKRLPASPARLEILDLGCGTGLAGIAFKDIAASIIGIDLSEKMLLKARETDAYARLICGDLIQEVDTLDCKPDIIVAADVFVYLTDLSPVFQSTRRCIKSGGLFAFSTERCDSRDYILRATGRTAHSDDYIRQLALDNRYAVISQESCILRLEEGSPVNGTIHILHAGEG